MPFAGLHDLPNLERIEIERGNHDRLFDGLDKLRTLKSLKLSVLMYMNDSDLDELKNLGQLKQLEMIYLRNITSAGLQNLRGLKLLEDLTLDEMGPVETDDLGFLNDLPSLKRLRLSDNTTVSDAAISTVIGLSKLTLLDLTQSHVSKASMDRLERARPHLTISGATAD